MEDENPNTLFLFLATRFLPQEVQEYAQENELAELFIEINLENNTWALCDDIGCNCDQDYRNDNWRKLDLESLPEIEEFLKEVSLEFIESEMENYSDN
jgi:hypothetical protein